MRVLHLLVLAGGMGALGLSLTGCMTLQGGPDRLYSVSEEVALARAQLDGTVLAAGTDGLVAQYNAIVPGPSTDETRMSYRNEIIARRMYIIDVEYSKYESALTSDRQLFGLGSAVTAQGLSTAGALFTPASTVRVLSGLTSGVNATRGFYDSELLVNKTIQIVQAQMESKRNDVASRIFGRVRESSLTYPLSAALHDLEDYYRAGTLTSGLLKATGEAVEAAKNSTDNKVAAMRNQALEGRISNVRSPLVNPGPFVLTGPNRMTAFEERLTPAKIQQIQAALCLEKGLQTGDLGLTGSETRTAMAAFFGGAGLPASQTITSIAMVNALNLAVIQVKVRTNGTCKSAGFADARAVGASLR